MSEFSFVKKKILKQISKHSEGISTESLIAKNNNDSSTTFILSELHKEEYVSRLISTDDKMRKAFGLESAGNTGDWIITDKGLSYLKNRELELRLKIVNRLIGFALGVAATFLGQFFIRLIFG